MREVKNATEPVTTTVKSHALKPDTSENECVFELPPEPCMIIIIGASGDLTKRKLIPGLFHLYLQGALPEPSLIVGASRHDISQDAFLQSMREFATQVEGFQEDEWNAFSKGLFYFKLDYEQPSSYHDLAAYLKSLDRDFQTKGNKIFYMALPMFQYKTVASMIGEAGLSRERENDVGWSRLVVEKPFGSNLKTAQDLDNTIRRYFKESQIFRIDHYMAKETVQNILMFRFANTIFEPLWNRGYIDHVDIIASETLGVENRAGYYEKSGVIRDMLQNHMMELLSLTAMEAPSQFEADRVRDEKVKIFRSLRPFPIKDLDKNLLMGQYGGGVIEGKKVHSYREEPGVAPDSNIPTFGAMKIFIDNWRWQGVPFFITSGKRMARKLTQIAIQFKNVPHTMFRGVLGDTISANRLILGIQPEERITLDFQTKNPGAHVCLRTVTMDFNYMQNYKGPTLDAYEKALLDCMIGDRTLFWRQDGVELCWSFFDPVLEECESCQWPDQRLKTYKAGSWGPTAMAEFKRNAENAE